MPKKLTEEKKNLIRKRLIQGCTIEEIAQELQIGRETVKRYKKKSPMPFNREQDMGDNCIKFDYTTSLTKMQENYNKKILKEIALYEDIEEGWCYHLTKNDIRRKLSGMWWSLIVYPESAPEHWINVLRARGYRFAVSPLHDKDTWNHDSPEMVNAETGEIIEKGARYKVGDRKKAHWHVIVVNDKKTGYMEMNAEMQEITHCPYIQKCRSLKNAYSYFTHINYPERYQYEKDEIQTYNNFHVEPNKYELGCLQDELFQLMREHNLDSYGKVVEFFAGQIEFIMLVSTRPGAVRQYADSLWRAKNPDGAVKRVKIVTDEEVKGKV